MNLAAALQLGRVSNLPTVWTNTLAGVLLVGGNPLDQRSWLALHAFTAFYAGGMFLNDAFDAEIDARERPERPILSGEVSRGEVYAWGFGLLVTGVVPLFVVGHGFEQGCGWLPAILGLALAGAIVLYDWHHKDNPLSPLVMGACRVLLYLAAGACFTASLPTPLFAAAALLLAYLVGLTYVAKRENFGRVENLWPLLFLAAPVIYGAAQTFASPLTGIFWLVFTTWLVFALYLIKRRGPGDIPRAVVSLIAGIPLLDGMLVAGAGFPACAGITLAGLALTLMLLRFVRGT